MTERNPYHKPAGSPEGGQFTTAQLGTITAAARKAAGLTERSMNFTIYDIYPDIDSTIAEVEANNNKINWKVVVDILNDFGVIPQGMTDEEYQKLIIKLAKEKYSIRSKHDRT